MYTHPDIGQLLAKAKIEEAHSRLTAVPALRAASLDRVARAAAARALVARRIPEAPTGAIVRRWLPRQAAGARAHSRKA